MNKYRFLSFAAAGAVMFAGVAFTSCSDDNDDAITGGLSVQAVSPTKVIEGQEITITGTGLDKVTAVVFPGDVKSTEIKKVGSGLISVITPANVFADGGVISVEADGETAYSRMSISLGHPVVNTVAPVDEEIGIGGNIQVYGTDLEFMSKAIFPGADGQEVVVNSSEFRRKSTSALYIYVPAGISAGEAEIKLVDVAGTTYTLPKVTLSDKNGGGEVEEPEEGQVLWSDKYEGSWTFLELRASDLKFGDLTPKIGQKLKFVFENTKDDSRFCICLGENWAGPDLGGENDPNNVSIANATEYYVDVTDAFLTELNGGIMRIGGVNFTLTKVVLVPQPLWEGEHETGWWWYLPLTDLNLSDAVIESGRHLKFTFKEHDGDQTFCLCDGNWGAPDIGGGAFGRDPNNTVIVGGQTELVCDLTDAMVTILKEGTAENAFILGGEVIITKIEIID